VGGDAGGDDGSVSAGLKVSHSVEKDGRAGQPNRSTLPQPHSRRRDEVMSRLSHISGRFIELSPVASAYSMRRLCLNTSTAGFWRAAL